MTGPDITSETDSDFSESYRFLSKDESELDTYNASTANFADLSFIRRGAKVLDNWDTTNESVKENLLSENINHHNNHPVRHSNLSNSFKPEDLDLDNDDNDDPDDTINLNKNSVEYSPSVAKKSLLDKKAANSRNQPSSTFSKSRINQLKNPNESSVIMHSTPLIKTIDSYPESIMKKANSSSNGGKRNVSFQLRKQSILSQSSEESNDDIGNTSEAVLANSSSLGDFKEPEKAESLESEIEEIKKQLLKKENELKKKQQEQKKKQEQEQKQEQQHPPKSQENKKHIYNEPLKIDKLKISIDTVPELGKLKKNGKTIYKSLELPDIDKLSQIEAQNVLKNICISLDVKYSKLPSFIVDIPNIEKSEQHLLRFANRIHFSLYGSNLRPPIIGINYGKINQNKMIQKSRSNFLHCLNDMNYKFNDIIKYVNEID